MPVLLANHAMQLEHGVEVDLLDAAALRERFGWLRSDDLAGGSLGLSGEGWFDAHALLQSFRRKARSLGVEYLAGEVIGIDRDRSGVSGVRLADGTRIGTRLVVNATGPRAAEVAEMVGLELPVHPRKRHIWHFDCRERIGLTPLTILPSGVYFRPEGEAWIAGYSPHAGEPDPDTLDLTPDRAFFDDFVWPELAARVPAFESVRLLDAWAGHYEVNSLDHNAVIGPHPDVPGFLFANGFSGHGLQQAPAVGRGLAELIATSHYETLDLSPLGYERIVREQPIRELNVV
jgi:sarcosine oxidase